MRVLGLPARIVLGHPRPGPLPAPVVIRKRIFGFFYADRNDMGGWASQPYYFNGIKSLRSHSLEIPFRVQVESSFRKLQGDARNNVVSDGREHLEEIGEKKKKRTRLDRAAPVPAVICGQPWSSRRKEIRGPNEPQQDRTVQSCISVKAYIFSRVVNLWHWIVMACLLGAQRDPQSLTAPCLK